MTMRTLLCTIAIFAALTCQAYSQNNDLENYVRKGVELYDSGDYEGAIEQYKAALAIDNTNPVVNYEISSAYFALKEYEKAIEYSDILIAQHSPHTVKAYTMKGSALDLLGKPREAIQAYKAAIEQHPNSDDHLLYYNIALTYYNLKEFKEAEEALQKATTIKPTHASSHLLLGNVMLIRNNRVKAVLTLSNFLLLEPTSTRAKAAYQVLEAELSKGVKKVDKNNTTIMLDANQKENEFNAAEIMLSMLEASKSLEDNVDKTEGELFANTLTSFFSVLGELKKENAGFWWEHYVTFYYDMVNNHHVEAFSYLISQAKEDNDEVTEWLANNKDKTDAFTAWYSQYKRK